MNVYWCHEKDDYCGLWILAEKRGKAKELFRHEVGCDFVDVRCQIHNKNIGDYKQGIIEMEDKTTLESLGLKYEDFDIYNYI